MSIAIDINNLTKQYVETAAIKNMTISLEKDKIYGLIGRNGAGKTTLLHMLAGHILPTEGNITIFNQPIYENKMALDQICFTAIFNSPSFARYAVSFRVKDIINTAANFYPNWDQDFANQLINEFGLSPKKKLKDLSTGMVSMVSVVVGLASRASVTLLDEPYTGLDASARHLFYDILAEDYGKHPRTIIFSTHLIDEASRLFENVILIDQGSLVFNLPIEHIEEMSYLIHGSTDILETTVRNKRIVHKESLGNNSSIAVFDSITSEELTSYKHAGLNIQNLSLQKLFVYLTALNRRAI
jgi:ABC-2 type transport system ATP-binding protein